MTATTIVRAALDTLPAALRCIPGLVIYSSVDLGTPGMRRYIVTSQPAGGEMRLEIIATRDGVAAGSTFVRADEVHVVASACCSALEPGVGDGLAGRLAFPAGGAVEIGYRRRASGDGAVTLQGFGPKGEPCRITRLEGAQLRGLDRACDAVIAHHVSTPPRHAT